MSWLVMRNRAIVLGGVMFGLALIVAVGAQWLASADPLALNPGQRLQPPGPQHLWGTDNLGRDLFSRTLYGARLSLLVGAGVSVLSVVLGTLIGLCAGYFRRVDSAMMLVMDGLMAFPSVLLALFIMATAGQRVENLMMALAVVMVPRIARVVRAAVLGVRVLPFVEAARSIGAGDARIMLRHVLPSCVAPITVQASYTFALAVLVEASLSFLGVGAPPEIPSLGNILADTRLYMRSSPWMPLLPGFMIVWIVLALNQLGDGLRDLLDPSMRS